MSRAYRQRIESLLKTNGFLDRRSVVDAGIHTQYLIRLLAEGALERIAPGRYRYPKADVTEHHGLVLASVAAPHGVVRYSGEAFSEGIEVHRIERQAVRVYSVAKTLADLFKARNRIGVEVAVEALREAWRDRRFKMAELDRAAKACRVERVMRPYVEGVVA